MDESIIRPGSEGTIPAVACRAVAIPASSHSILFPKGGSVPSPALWVSSRSRFSRVVLSTALAVSVPSSPQARCRRACNDGE